MLKETIEYLNISPSGVYIDGTLGGGGHSFHVAERLDSGLLIGVDQDDFAIEKAKVRLAPFEGVVKIVKANFSQIDAITPHLPKGLADGVILDLGVSSFQLDDGGRGFSYKNDGPLDMRMDNSRPLSAYDVVNFYKEDKLKEIFLAYGEEKWSARVAKFIVERREEKLIETSFELVDIIKAAIPKAARKDGPHPAKRVFQAIRIEVNNELGIIEQSIKNFVDILAPGGRLCIITFHSLEDRIVKNTFSSLKNPCACPRGFPMCVCNKKPLVDIITKKPIAPSESELSINPRARSAKLRVAEKL